MSNIFDKVLRNSNEKNLSYDFSVHLSFGLRAQALKRSSWDNGRSFYSGMMIGIIADRSPRQYDAISEEGNEDASKSRKKERECLQ